MPTARELLEQADALMRRNRPSDAEIPVLTDVVEDANAEARARGGGRRRDALREASSERTPREERTPPRTAEPPTLIDAVEEVAVEVPAPPPEPGEGEPLPWLGPDTVDPALHSVTGPAPDTVSVVPPVVMPEVESEPEVPPVKMPEVESEPEPLAFFIEPDPSVTRTLRAAGSAPTPAPAGSMPSPASVDEAAQSPAGAAPAGDDERWRALAEQISMQVLQRIDLFTDTGLKAQLASHLEPIVAQASAELVEAINDHVGKLIRSYVAEAIEREIAQWRENNQ